jgi:hypothetical protein
LGAQAAQGAACERGATKTVLLKPVIGLLDNSKPNVAPVPAIAPRTAARA